RAGRHDGNHEQHGRGDAALHVALQPGALRVGVAEDEDVLHEVSRNELERLAAIAPAPRLDHRIDGVAVAEPAEEVLVDGDSPVGGEHPARQAQSLLAVALDAEEPAEDVRGARLLAAGLLSLADLGHHPRQPRERRVVDERSVTDLARHLEHPLAQGRDVDRNGLGRELFELEAARTGALAREGGPYELDGLAHARTRLLERDAVPA